MNLSIDNALHGIAELQRDRIGPAIGDSFAAQMARLSCMLLTISANWVDDAVELRVEENAAIRELLGEAAALLDAPVTERMLQASRSSNPGLRISVLDAENHRLRGLLIEVHAAVEALANDPAALSLNRRVWQFLEATEAKRAPRE
jgi:hypothetical protein